MRRITIFLLMTLAAACAGNETAAIKSVGKYFDVDSLIRGQTALLASLQPQLLKKAHFENELDTVKFRPDSAEWGKEMEIFLQLDLNEPTLRDEYTEEIEDDTTGGIKMLCYKAKDPSKVAVDYVKVHFKDGAVKSVEGRYAEKSLLYSSERQLNMEFRLADGRPRVTSYSIDGRQKVIFQDSAVYTIDAEVTYAD